METRFRSRLHPVARTTLAGTAVGTAYGATLRGWMRLITDDPSFTWGGSGYVVGVFAVLGTSAGLATAGRNAGWVARLLVVRAVGIVLGLGCFVAAGAAMLPTILPAATGLARTDWPRWLRRALVGVGVLTCAAFLVERALQDPGTRQVVGLAVYPALCAVEVAITARLYAPTLRRGALLRRRATSGRLTAA